MATLTKKPTKLAKRRGSLATPEHQKQLFLSHLKTAEHINSHIYDNIRLYPLWYVLIDHTYLSSVREYDAILDSSNSIKTHINFEIYNGIMALDESNKFKFKCLTFVGMIYFKSKFKFRKEHKFAKSGCAISFHSKVLEKIFNCRDLYKMKQYLEDFGVIEIGHEDGIVGFHTKTYKIAKKYFDNFHYVRLYFPLKITESLFKSKKSDEEYVLDEMDTKRQKFFLDVLNTCSLAEGHLDTVKNVSDDTRNLITRYIDKMYNKSFTAKPDKKTGRWFTWATCCPRCLRKFILIDGQETVEIDYGNMQPWLCLTFYEDSDYENPNTQIEIIKYKEISKTNKFYSFFAGKAGVNIENGESKDAFKQRVFKEIFFGPTNTNHLLWSFFSQEFPILSKRVAEFKSVDYTLSSIKLQKMEARIVISGVLDKLIANGIKCLTVHDSIICKKDDYKFVHRLMGEEFKKIMDDDPILKTK